MFPRVLIPNINYAINYEMLTAPHPRSCAFFHTAKPCAFTTPVASSHLFVSRAAVRVKLEPSHHLPRKTIMPFDSNPQKMETRDLTAHYSRLVRAPTPTNRDPYPGIDRKNGNNRIVPIAFSVTHLGIQQFVAKCIRHSCCAGRSTDGGHSRTKRAWAEVGHRHCHRRSLPTTTTTTSCSSGTVREVEHQNRQSGIVIPATFPTAQNVR
jgi:hypothetical protein